jgi:LPS-assembly lipoprotein
MGGWRTKAGGALAAVLLPGLAACGFTPMYARPGVDSGMARIALQTPQTRTGFLLREQLEDMLAIDVSAPPRYRLAIQLREDRKARGVIRNDTPNRYETTLVANYMLTEIGSGKVLLVKAAPVHITTDSTDQPYASVAAQKDAQVRAAYNMAQVIKTDVAAAFAAPQ